MSEELIEMREQIRQLEDDYDILGKFLIAYCSLPKGTVPDIGITPTKAYLTLMTRGTKDLRPQLQAFVDFVKPLVSMEQKGASND